MVNKCDSYEVHDIKQKVVEAEGHTYYVNYVFLLLATYIWHILLYVFLHQSILSRPQYIRILELLVLVQRHNVLLTQ